MTEPEIPVAPNPADDEESAIAAELADVAERATAGQVMAAIGEAIRTGELEAAVGLLGILTRKDPHAADLIVRTIQYRPQPATGGST